MKYCHNCGNKVNDADCFCAECGTRLVLEDAPDLYGQKDDAVYGYIFTNVKFLSKKLSVSRDRLLELINAFINARSEQGVQYMLLDVSDYEVKTMSREKISLQPTEGWETHQRLLMDRYSYDVDKCGINVCYLYIIGGHDIIPMPSVGKHILPKDGRIDTDIPYSSLYGSKTEAMIDDGTIFQSAQMLFVGRLPLAADATFNDLINCFQNTVDVAYNGLDSHRMYGQCDPHWKGVSGSVTCDLHEAGCFPEYEADSKYYYRSLWLTPYVTVKDNTIDEVFDRRASCYYFNMHGSNAPQVPQFIGVGMNEGEGSYIGVCPEHIASAECLNMLVTEACYGARFIGRKKNESMLLSAMSGKTVVYIGSSRIAFGAGDENCVSGVYPISSADIIASAALTALHCGVPAGVALYYARQAVVEAQKISSVYTPTTLMEFNLFGDPSLAMYYDEDKSSVLSKYEKGVMPKAPICETLLPVKIERKDLYNRAGDNSILNIIRQKVDDNVMQISKTIEMHLYANYNISPRHLESVIQYKTSFGEKSCLYQYLYGDFYVLVETDGTDKICNVLTTK